MTAYATAITSRRKPRLTFVLEIEGLPTAYSSRAVDSDWYTAGTPRLASNDRPTEVKSCFLTENSELVDPKIGSTELDFLAGRSAMTTCSLSLVDLDGELAQLTGLRRRQDSILTRDISSTDTTLTITGGDAAAVAGSEFIFIGRETMSVDASSLVSGDYQITPLLVGGKRAWFRSQQTKHVGQAEADGEPHARGNGVVGAMVSTFPRHLVDRKCWLRVGLDARNDSECFTGFIGTVRSFNWTGAGRVLVLNLEDAQTRLSRPIFTDFASMWRAATEHLSVQAFTEDDFTPVYHLDMEDIEPSLFRLAADEYFLSVVDDGDFCQVVMFRVGGSEGGSRTYAVFVMDERYWLTDIAANFRVQPGHTWSLGYQALSMRPLLLIAGEPSASTNAPGWMWPRKPITTAQGPVLQTDHVLAVLLMILCTSPTGTNGDWDCLPFEEWGLGIPEDEVDVAGIVDLARRNPGARVRFPVLDVVPNARAWFDALLRPYGWILVLRADGKIGVASLQPLTPGQRAALATIRDEDLAKDSNTGQPLKVEGPSGDGAQRITALTYRASPFIRDGKIELREPATLQIADVEDALETAGAVEPLAIEAPGIYPEATDIAVSERWDSSNPATGRWVSRNGLTAFMPPPDRPAALTQYKVFADLAAALQTRYRGTPSIYTVRTTFRKWLVSLGDFVKLTLANKPNPFTGQRGLTSVVAQVVRRQPLFREGAIEFDLAVSDAGNEETRFVCPTLDIDAGGWNAGTGVATVKQHSFTDAGGSVTDTYPFTVGGVGVGDTVRIYSEDFAWRSQALRVTAKTSGTVTLVDPLGATILLSPQKWSDTPRAPQEDDMIRFGDYSECTTHQKEIYAFYVAPNGKHPTDDTGATYSF